MLVRDAACQTAGIPHHARLNAFVMRWCTIQPAPLLICRQAAVFGLLQPRGLRLSRAGEDRCLQVVGRHPCF